ncbi:NADH oxidase [Rubrobacter xylanophilus]|uniref:NADH oxidase n=1 Tax=Rubrobacter xylanophilus TaxID=49319 RepID=A0A510HPH5_9ACTN|nr:FAD-dependent oxidoreductase [Rubrobacter xylanophilus]BBL80773.1 NADH oxidase [Rubrobacter xylanophilus]
MRLVVVGGVAAGTKAAARARRVNPHLKIVVYQEEPEPSISECGLPYLLSGTVEGRRRLVARTPQEFARSGIRVLVRHRVEELEPDRKRLVVRDLFTGATFEDRYDRLILATGARAKPLAVEGSHLEGVFNLRFLTDADRILDHLRRHRPSRALVVGGGYVGLEVAENLRLLGMEVTLVQRPERVATAYDPEISRRIEDHLREHGVEVRTSAEVEEFRGAGRVREALVSGERVRAELVVAGVGIEPETTLARRAGARIGTTGAVWTDRHQRTSLPEVWAAGDCVQTRNRITGEPAWVPLGDTANQMGRVAGTNAALGEDVEEFPGVLGTGIFKVFDLAAGKTGLSEQEAKRAGLEAVAAGIESRSRAGYYPGAGRVLLKLVAEKGSGRLLGAQALGPGADKLTDVCATALWGGLSCSDLVNLDLAYAPPYGPVLSPVIQAATVLQRRLSQPPK